jgi:membrane protein implicated in regulation of membrane protease activity
MGIFFIILTGSLLVYSLIRAALGWSVQNSVFILIGIMIILLVLPFIRKFKLGSIDVELDAQTEYLKIRL